MALSPFMAAIQQICLEKNLPEEKVIGAVEAALAAAYRRDFGKPGQSIRVLINRETEGFTVEQVFEVVATEEEIEESDRQITPEQAEEMGVKKAEPGTEVIKSLPYQDDFGRIAAMTAKQVIVQRLREAERDVLLDEFRDKEHQLLTGHVQQFDLDTVLVNLGKANAIMPPREQIRGEVYTIGQRVRVYVKEVADGFRGPQVIVSRADAEFIRALFELEVPEIPAGAVEIKAIAREAGSRTKMAVYASNPALDPVGSCVGQRGTRVQAVLGEIGEEKIDIILWDESDDQFIRNALSPAKVRDLTLDPQTRVARVGVDPDQLSLAIGRSGQNVRLASKLTGYTIDILRDEVEEMVEAVATEQADSADIAAAE